MEFARTLLKWVKSWVEDLFSQISDEVKALDKALDLKQPVGDYVLRNEIEDPPVTSVNGMTGNVVIEIPVISVNGQTGDVVINIPDINAPKTEFILNSSTEGSTKRFKITVDDNGTLTTTEIVEETA